MLIWAGRLAPSAMTATVLTCSSMSWGGSALGCTLLHTAPHCRTECTLHAPPECRVGRCARRDRTARRSQPHCSTARRPDAALLNAGVVMYMSAALSVRLPSRRTARRQSGAPASLEERSAALSAGQALCDVCNR